MTTISTTTAGHCNSLAVQQPWLINSHSVIINTVNMITFSAAAQLALSSVGTGRDETGRDGAVPYGTGSLESDENCDKGTVSSFASRSGTRRDRRDI